MDTTYVNGTFFDNGWGIYLVSILILVVLYFIQKNAYLIDRKLNQLSGNKSNWEGNPWPLILGLLLGIFTLLYNVFSPNDMQWIPVNWHWPEYVLLAAIIVCLILLSFESISHFGWGMGLIRILIYTLLAIGFFYAGSLAGLLIATILALGVLIYFFRNWRKIMVLK